MITEKDVVKIAQLSRLEVPSSDLQKFTGQMNQILGFIEELNQLSTENVLPTAHAVEMPTPFREDIAVHSKIREAVFDQAPEHEANFFRVPKVI